MQVQHYRIIVDDPSRVSIGQPVYGKDQADERIRGFIHRLDESGVAEIVFFHPEEFDEDEIPLYMQVYAGHYPSWGEDFLRALLAAPESVLTAWRKYDFCLHSIARYYGDDHARRHARGCHDPWKASYQVSEREG